MAKLEDVLKDTGAQLAALRRGFFFWLRESHCLAALGGQRALARWAELNEQRLFAAYDALGAERGSGPEAFARFVPAWDRIVGLRASVEASAHQLTYRLENPFSGQSAPHRAEDTAILDAAIEAKRKFFLPGFRSRRTKNTARGDAVNEWVFEKA